VPYRNTAITETILAWNLISGAGQTGDAANITLRLVGDGVEATPSSPAITQIDSTNLPGWYKFSLTAGENNYSLVTVSGISSTSGVVIVGKSWANEITSTLAAGTLFIKKNTALANFMFMMTDSTTNAPKTGLTVTATRSIDGAAFAAAANSVSEVSSGWYKINLAATDVNGTVIALRFSATGANDRDLTIVTQT